MWPNIKKNKMRNPTTTRLENIRSKAVDMERKTGRRKSREDGGERIVKCVQCPEGSCTSARN